MLQPKLISWFFEGLIWHLGHPVNSVFAQQAINWVQPNESKSLSKVPLLFCHVLVKGKNSREGSGEELLNNPEVRKSFLGG